MLRKLAIVMVFSTFSTYFAFAQEPKKEDPKKPSPDAIKWETTEFEAAILKELGLKMKTLTVVPANFSNKGITPPDRVKFLLEFDKDVDYKPGSLQTTLCGSRAIIGYNQFFFYGRPNTGGGRVDVVYYDDENVRIGRDTSITQPEGEITGKKGETFRVYLKIEMLAVFQKAKRIEVYFHPRFNIQDDKLSADLTKNIKWETAELEKVLETDLGLKLKTTSVVTIDKERHVMLNCERNKVVENYSTTVSDGLECRFSDKADTVLDIVKKTKDMKACCIDDGELGSQKVGSLITIFVRTPPEAVLSKTTKAVLRVVPPVVNKGKE